MAGTSVFESLLKVESHVKIQFYFKGFKKIVFVHVCTLNPTTQLSSRYDVGHYRTDLVINNVQSTALK